MRSQWRQWGGTEGKSSHPYHDHSNPIHAHLGSFFKESSVSLCKSLKCWSIDMHTAAGELRNYKGISMLHKHLSILRNIICMLHNVFPCGPLCTLSLYIYMECNQGDNTIHRSSTLSNHKCCNVLSYRWTSYSFPLLLSRVHPDLFPAPRGWGSVLESEVRNGGYDGPCIRATPGLEASNTSCPIWSLWECKDRLNFEHSDDTTTGYTFILCGWGNDRGLIESAC